MEKCKIIAFYLPQFYPFKENDEWWGKGFTEWTNVGKSKPLFHGHYQPKVPADLGYYDLRLPEVAEAQVELAKEAGIYAFCYWHYWFGNGKELLDMPFKRALVSGKPDFPFCLGWAAESWMAKTWNKDGKATGEILIEQRFPGKEDNEAHFYAYMNAFKDPRYVKVDGRPFFMLYGLKNFPDVKGFIEQWNYLIRINNIAESFYFVGYANTKEEILNCKGADFSAISTNLLMKSSNSSPRLIDYLKRIPKRFKEKILKRPNMIDYEELVRNSWDDNCSEENYLPMLLPNWDHTSRSGYNGTALYNDTPENWEKMCEIVVANTSKKSNKIILLKSWNEWGEGNYLEPDLKFGKRYIEILGKIVKE